MGAGGGAGVDGDGGPGGRGGGGGAAAGDPVGAGPGAGPDNGREKQVETLGHDKRSENSKMLRVSRCCKFSLSYGGSGSGRCRPRCRPVPAGRGIGAGSAFARFTWCSAYNAYIIFMQHSTTRCVCRTRDRREISARSARHWRDAVAQYDVWPVLTPL